MRTLLQFMSEFSASKDTFTLMAEFQEEINDMAKSREYHKEEHYKLKDEVERLRQELKKRPPVETVQHNLEVKQQVNSQLQKEVEQLRQQLAEMTEARNALAAVLETKTQAKVFYKGSPDTDWIPLGTGHVTLEFKSASSIPGSDKPLKSESETVIIDDQEYTSHSVRKLETKTKEELIKLCTRQARELTHLLNKWKELKKQYADLEHRHGKVHAHREELAASVGLLSEKIHKLQTELEEAKKAHRTACENYAKKINILCSGKASLEAGPDLFTARKELLDAKDEVEKLKRELNVVKSDYQNYKNKTFKAIYSPEAQNLHTQAQVSDLRRALEREQSDRRNLISKFIMVLAKHVTDPAIIKCDADLVSLFDAVLTDYQRSLNHSLQKVEGLCTSLNERNMKIADLKKKISELQQTMTDCFTTLRKLNNAQPSN